MLERIGFDAEMTGWAAAADLALGRVARVEQGLIAALTETGPARTTVGGRLLAEMARDPLTAPCPGDWALLRSWPDHRSTIERLLPRRTALCCTAAGLVAHQHALCANVDLAAVVVPQAGARRKQTQRLLELAGTSGVEAEVITGPGVGVARLRELVAGHRTVALLAASGSDTSAVVDALVGASVLSAWVGGRRGSPVRRQLVALPGGGAVIDMGPARCSHCSHDVRPRTGETGPRRP